MSRSARGPAARHIGPGLLSANILLCCNAAGVPASPASPVADRFDRCSAATSYLKVRAQNPLVCLLMVHCLLNCMLLARLKGAEKRANTRPSMMKLIRLEKMTCMHITHLQIMLSSVADQQSAHGNRRQQQPLLQLVQFCNSSTASLLHLE